MDPMGYSKTNSSAVDTTTHATLVTVWRLWVKNNITTATVASLWNHFVNVFGLLMSHSEALKQRLV